eukprot:3808309-Pleurochrysis_carterae.AAC.1
MPTQEISGAAEIAGDRDLAAELRIACGHFRPPKGSAKKSITHVVVCFCDATLVLHRVGWGGSKKKESFAGCGCGRA